MHDSTASIPIKRGVCQGDPASPKWFSATLEQVFQELDWKEKGIRVNGTFPSHICFADDITIIAQDANTLQDMLQELAQHSGTVRFKMNMSKSKVMSMNAANNR